MRKAQEDAPAPLKLIQSVPTRWNSTYQLERFLKLAEKIAPILLKYPKAPPMLTVAEIEIVQDLVKIFEPLEAITKEISEAKYVTSSIVIPMINCLCATLQRYNPSISVGVKTINLILDIKKRFGCVKQVSLLVISTIMDPRFKKIHFNDSLAYSQAITKIKQMLNKIPTPVQPITSQGSNLPESDKKSFLWSFHEKLVQNQQPRRNDSVSDDLKSYLHQPLSDLKHCEPIRY